MAASCLSQKHVLYVALMHCLTTTGVAAAEVRVRGAEEDGGATATRGGGGGAAEDALAGAGG